MRGLLRAVVFFIALYASLVLIGRLSQLPNGPVLLVAGGVVLVIGSAVAWLATRGARGPRSGRGMGDERFEIGLQPPPAQPHTSDE